MRQLEESIYIAEELERQNAETEKQLEQEMSEKSRV